MLRRAAITPTRSHCSLFDDEPVAFESAPDAETIRRTFQPAIPVDERDDDELGVRALLDRPEAQARAWRATERAWSPGRRHRDRRERASRSRRG